MSVVPRAPTLCGRVARVATALPARSIRVRVFVCYKGFAASADSSVTTDLLHVQEHSCHVRLGRCHRRPLVREMANRMRLLRRVCWPLCKLVTSLVFKIWSVVVILPAFCRYSVLSVCDAICLYKLSCVQILGSALMMYSHTWSSAAWLGLAMYIYTAITTSQIRLKWANADGCRRNKPADKNKEYFDHLGSTQTQHLSIFALGYTQMTPCT